MKFTNIFDKLNIIFNMIIDSNIFTIFTILLVFVLLLKLCKKISNKKMSIAIYLMEIITFGIVFYEKKEFLSSLFNTLIDKIFIDFYFPSPYIYLFIFVLSFIIFIYGLLNRVMSKTYKIITNIYFITFNFIFILLVNTISNNKIDIFNKASLFTNNECLILLEISTLLFAIYLILNSLIYITNSIILFVSYKKVNTVTETPDNIINTNTNIVLPEVASDNEYEKSSVSFNTLVEQVNMNNKVNKIDLVPEVKDYYDNKLGYKFIDPTLFDNTNKYEKEEVSEKLNFVDFNVIEKSNYDKLTLKDYKLFSNMLKTVIENNKGTNLTLSDILNRDLLKEYSYDEYLMFKKILNSCLN